MTTDPLLLDQARAFATPYYMQPQRAYHNLHHVEQMLEALSERGVLDTELALAVWGHDLIYDPRASDNEEQSARLFDGWLLAQGVDRATREHIYQMILATQHQAPPAGREAALLVDADLGILGAEWAEFAAYNAAIRQEYAHVPAPLYRLGRRKVLRGFLKRPHIYTTPEFAGLEAQARANLQWALKHLV